MPYDKALGTLSYKNSTPALPILLADFTKLFSSIADFGKYVVNFLFYMFKLLS
ncbi:MAG TPA: hypothetical protein HPP56_10080 [Nitrospirae bacterium]|nr:hypothetical protein [Nitrospirota bacterium]